MGASVSKIEEDKALVLCQERKRYVREALDGRFSLAAAHFAYIQSLKNTGTALRKFIQPEVQESSLYTSTSGTPEPPDLRLNLISRLPNNSPSSYLHVDTRDSSPDPSPLPSEPFQVNHMKAARSLITTVKEKPPVTSTATLKNSPPRNSRSGASDVDNVDVLPPGAAHWDFFGIFHPDENQFTFSDRRELSDMLENADEIRRLREEEGIPELEEEGDKTPASIRKDDIGDSEDDFDKPSEEPLVRMFRNRNINSDQSAAHDPAMVKASEKSDPEYEQQKNYANEDELDKITEGLPHKELAFPAQFKINGEPREAPSTLDIEMYESDDETPVLMPKNGTTAPTLPSYGRLNEAVPKRRHEVKDILSCMNEIEGLFIKASDSGKEVPRMLDANKVHFRPMLLNDTDHGSRAAAFFKPFVACCGNTEVLVPPASAPTEMKYLTWHRSVSSNSSTSRIPLGATVKEEVDGLTGNIFSGVYMNSGSHASTLDRLFAWEKKLYDEVKASSFIRQEYEIKCRLLRHQESKGEDQYRIDRTRAAVKDLHSRIFVAIQRIDWISKKIDELRDKELQPQLEELIGSLARMWEAMSDCHRNQCEVLELASKSGIMKVPIRSESQRQAAFYLEVELKTLCSSFATWIASHRSYLLNINLWLNKCVVPQKQKSSKWRPAKVPPRDFSGVPPIFLTCEDWLKLLEKLPVQEVEESINDLAAAAASFAPRQEKRPRTNAGVVRRLDSPGELSQDCERLMPSLAAFLDRLKVLSELSARKYRDLQDSIADARGAYDGG